MRFTKVGVAAAALVSTALLGACQDDQPLATQLAMAGSENKINAGGPQIRLQDRSVTPALVRLVDANATAYSIVGSDDVLPNSPGFVFGGSADGAGLIKNADGTFTMLVNHEDNFSVSRITLDKDMRPISGEYLLNSSVGLYRLCSATLVTPEEHGFGPVFLTAGESGRESQIHAVDPFGPVGKSTLLTAFGRWSAENAVPLPKQAYPGKTVVLIGDDDSGTNGGQVAMYLSNSVGDLDTGKLFVMAPASGSFMFERDVKLGQKVDVVFTEVPNQKSLTGAQIDAFAASVNAFQFGRVEDLDYRKGAGAGREVYFAVTGQNNSGVNAAYTRTKYGRVYRLAMAPNDPTRGTLEVILDGDERGSQAGAFQNPDNILVTRNFVYVQEDPNGYRDETHDAYIYQYDIAKQTLKVVMELDHRRGDAKYNVGGASRFGSWEYGAMLDVSHLLGGNGNNGTFLIAVQPHTWRDAKYQNPDKGTLRLNENQASQMIVVTGLPR